jgi:hypothetical protein
MHALTCPIAFGEPPTAGPKYWPRWIESEEYSTNESQRMKWGLRKKGKVENGLIDVRCCMVVHLH